MILGLAGWSGSGKTTLISNLIPQLKNIENIITIMPPIS